MRDNAVCYAENHRKIKEQKMEQVPLLEQETEKVKNAHHRKTFLASLGCPSTGQ
jgi:hypothetical protein